MDLAQSLATGTLNTRAYKSGSENIAGSGTKVQMDAYKQVASQMEKFITDYTGNITKEVEKLQKGGDSDLNEIQKYLTKVDTINKEFLGNIHNLTQSRLNNNSLFNAELKTLQQQIKKIYKQLETEMNKQEGSEDILELCKELADGLSAGIGASNYIGDMGEAITQIAAKKLVKTVMGEIKNLGHETSKRGLNEVHFEGIIDIESLAGTKEKFGDFTLTAEAEKQDLVDVSITLDDGQEMNLSVKARKPNSSGAYRVGFAIANVLELLQNENQDDFINHFLNLNGLKELEDVDETKSINALVKKIVLAKMVAGYNREVASGDYLAANYFVVIDSNPKNLKAYVVPMSKLLQYIFANDMHNKVPIPSGILEANKFIEGDGGVLIRLNNVMKRLAVPSKVSYNFTPTMLEAAKDLKK